MFDWVPWIKGFWGLLKRAQIAEAAAREAQDRLREAEADLGDCRGLLVTASGNHGAVWSIPAPSLDAHFLPYFWACLWFERKPIPVYRHPDCALSADEVRQSLDLWNAVAPQVTDGKLPAFFVLNYDATHALHTYGVMLYGATIPPQARAFPWDVPSPYYLAVPTKRYRRDPETPWPAMEKHFDALDCRPGESTVLALAHELGHTLGLADHYWNADPAWDGKEGLYPVDSIMGDVSLGITAHDAEDLTTLYQSALLRPM